MNDLTVRFAMETERHDKAKFQAEGHFVPGMNDLNGFRREWDGPLVFVGTIWQEVRDVQGQVTGKNQVLRVLADSPIELERLMRIAVYDSFFAWWSAQQLQASTFESYRKHIDEHNELVAAFAHELWMPADAASMSTARLLRHAVTEFSRRIEVLRDTSEGYARRCNELYNALPWWSKRRKA